MRRLTEADRRAWDAYRRSTDPLDRARRDRAATARSPDAPSTAAPLVDPPLGPTPAPVSPPVGPPVFRMGERARTAPPRHDLAPALPDVIGAAPVAMDRKAFHRLKAGKLRPEAKLDLHGLTLDRAHPRLIDFVQRNHARGNRLLLVVTGKGKRRDEGGPIPTPFGVLRQQVPQWLRMPPLGPLVLQVAQAHRSHGGAGAYYVYLRRGR